MNEAEASAPEAITHPSGEDTDSQKIDELPKRDLEKSSKAELETEEEEEEEEEEETCGFCKFMKAGGCKKSFVKWMDCVDTEKAKGNAFVETCMTQIQDLRECMLAHEDYYRPMLEEEQSLMDDTEDVDDEVENETTEKNEEEVAKEPSQSKPTSPHR
eukprot:g6839.t1